MQAQRFKTYKVQNYNGFKKQKNQSFVPQLKPSIPSIYTYSLKMNKKALVPVFHWQNQWKNLHLQYKSLLVKEILFHYFLKRKLLLNNFYYHKYHGGLRLIGNTFGFYSPKLPKLFKKYVRSKNDKNKQSIKTFKFRGKINKQKKKVFLVQPKLLKEAYSQSQYNYKLKSMSNALLAISSCPKLSMCFTHYYLPKTYLFSESYSVFSRYKKIQNFWEGLQIMRLIVENKAMAQVLARFVYTSIRRNPKRAAFIIYIKRLIDWHFATAKNLNIQGIRIEVKGRFNAKSRARKYILSVGRVAKQEKTSNVDYAFIEAFTIFGSLGIKVWVCPEINKNVVTTTQNKVSKSTQRAN